MAKRTRKPRVKKVTALPVETGSVAVPERYVHATKAAAEPDKERVETVPVKRKKRWWESMLYGDDK